MNEHIQIALFFPERVIYDPTKLCNALLEKFPELGQPIILPFDISANQDNGGIPVAIFSQTSEMNLTLTFNNFVFTLFEDKREEKLNILKSFFEIADNFNLKFSRIGYVNNILMPESEILNFKKSKFKDLEIINSEEFQISWFNKITIDDIILNYWQSYNTKKDLTDDLFVTHDVNTLSDEKYDINFNFISKFIKSVDNFLGK